MNVFQFVLLLVLIVTIGGVVRGRYGDRRGLRRKLPGLSRGDDDIESSAETRRLREEVRELKDRIKVLERIAVDKENSLAREIEDLRER